MARKSRTKGRRLNDDVVAALPVKKKQYTIWDLAVEGCGVRVSSVSRSFVTSIRVGKKRDWKTLGVITEEKPYSYWMAKASERIADLKGKRLPRAAEADGDTLRKATLDYINEHPELRVRTTKDYMYRMELRFSHWLDQGFERLTRQAILDLNSKHLAKLRAADPDHEPPYGYYSWQSALRAIRTVIRWRCSQKDIRCPWPDNRALPIVQLPRRKLPLELRSAAGRRKLIFGLRAMDTLRARACLFLCYTGFRRREGMRCTAANLAGARVLRFRSKTRELEVPLSRQAAQLIDPKSRTTLLKVSEYQLRKPLIKLFGERITSRGKRKSVVTPHDLRRLFKSCGTEANINHNVLNVLVGHALQGADESYISSLRMGVLGEAVQKIADELDNPSFMDGEDALYYKDANEIAAETAPQIQSEVPAERSLCSVDDFLPRKDDDVIFPVEKEKEKQNYKYMKREALHQLVWTVPIDTLAKNHFGVSGVALSKTCRRARIPVPGRGYWAQIDAGMDVSPTPLPSAPARFNIVRIRDKLTPPVASVTMTTTTPTAVSNEISLAA